MSPKKEIRLFVDVISPYSWVAFESLIQYEKVLPAELKIVLVSLGGIMKESGNRPPMMLPARAMYMPNDLKMTGKYWGIDIRPNPNFATEVVPRGTITALRFLLAVQQEQPDRARAAIRAYFSRVWHSHESVAEEKDIRDVAKLVGISNVDHLITLSKTEQIKSLLKQNTAEALESGAFGAPWIRLLSEGEPDRHFFGSDRLPILCNELGVGFRGPLAFKHHL